jgi:hypothetical protein
MLVVEQCLFCLSSLGADDRAVARKRLRSRSGLNFRPAALLLGASDLTLFSFYQLVASGSALRVSETSASEDGILEERLRGGKPS